MKQFALIFVSVLAFAPAVSGQIAPPTFLCVSNDTLAWEIPTNNCGPFNAYVIYASQQESGPYSVLATVNDPAQEFFFHQNAGAGTWYYYLESDFDCPGQTALPSDTLDNLIPITPLLEAVSVDGQNVEVSWLPSPSPEVVGYVISRNVAGQGTTALDTVFSGTTYLDTGASPGGQSETYFVEAIDGCGNKSLVGEPHRTILLSSEGSSPCERSISLNWNLYQNWAGGIAEHEIWVSRDGGPEELLTTLGGNADTYTAQDIDDGVAYCFTIRAIQQNTGVEAASNEVCLSVDVVQAVRTLALTNATVNPDGQVVLEYLWNPNAEIDDATILRSDNNSDFTGVDSGTPSLPLSMANSYLDAGAGPDKGPLYYQVQATDACNEVVSSNVAATIFLRVSAGSGFNTIRWTPLLNTLATVSGYELYRIGAGGTPQLIGTFGPNTLEAVDDIDLGDPEQLLACYYVEGIANVMANDSLEVPVRSRSNIACAQQEATIYIPNAFSPNDDGRNDEFAPFLQFGAPADYTLAIYGRWGGKLFESSDINRGWDGKANGTRVPVGLYVYYLRVEQENGTVIEQTGEISLLR